MKKKYTLFICIFFILLNLTLYRDVLFTNNIINARDIISSTYHGRAGFNKYLKFLNMSSWSCLKLLGSDESHTVFPTQLPDRFFFNKFVPVASSFAWQMVFAICLGGIFMYMLCRTLGLSYFSSMLAGLFFMMSSEIVTYMNAGHVEKLVMMNYTPLFIFFIEKGFKEKKIFNFLLAGLALGYVFSYKHEQMMFYICLLVAYYTIFRLYYLYNEETNKDFSTTSRVFSYSFVMTLTFFAIAAAALLPTLNWIAQTERSSGVAYNYAISWSFPPEEILTYLFPKMFGISSPNMLDPEKIKVFYWGRMPFTQTSDYLGLFPLFFALTALVFNRNKYTKIFSILLLIIFPLAMGGFNPLYEYVLKYIPGFKMLRVPKAILALSPLAVSVMAGFGIEWIFTKSNVLKLENEKKEKFKKFITKLSIAWIAVFVFAIIGWIFKENIIEVFTSTIKWDDLAAFFNASTYVQKYEYFYESVISFLIISAIILVWCYLKNNSIVSENILKGICAIVFIFDIGMFNDKFLSTVPVEYVDTVKVIPPAMNYLKEKEKKLSIPYRVFPNVRAATEYNQPNGWTLHFQIIGGSTGVKQRLYTKFMENVDFDNRLLDILNVKYIAIDRQALPYPNLSKGIKVSRYYIDYFDDKVVILENPNRRQRVDVAYKYQVESPENVFSAITSPSYDPLTTVVLEEAPEENISTSREIVKEKTKILQRETKPGIYDLEVEMPETGFLVFSDSYYPGWKAYIDGKETKIYKTDYVVRSILVPAGKHEVKMIFKPMPLIIGLWITGVTFLGILIIIGLRIAGKFDY